MRYVEALSLAGVALSTTDRNADEVFKTLIEIFDLSVDEAAAEVARVLASFTLLDADSYAGFRSAAERRLRQGGKPDWPALAAALSLDCAIWSEDVDFFGTGVPVWTTANVLLCAAEK